MPLHIKSEEWETLDLDALCQDIKLPDKNLYIANDEKAMELIASLIQNDERNAARAIKKIRGSVDGLFVLLKDLELRNGLELYEQFLDLCARLSARQKIQKIQDKVVISFGGAFSAGKSKFINSISGIKDILPVAQAPTTSIPTYIIKSKEDVLKANCGGRSARLLPAAMDALTHEFYDVYGIGFSAFVDSIIVESSLFSLPEGIALLDTPGYTKPDDKGGSKETLSDRQRAFEQLRASDYLIWLANIEGGGLTKEDIEFIESLRIKTPVLIVFTKADKKTRSEIQAIVDETRRTVQNTAIDCFGVTAYSSNQNMEYGNYVIPQFINFTLSGGVRGNDILTEFDRLENEITKQIQFSIRESRKTARTLFSYITHSNRFLDIRSLAALWGKANQKGYWLSSLSKEYETAIRQLRLEIMKYIKAV